MTPAARIPLITKLEKLLKGDVIVYFLSDRPTLPSAPIAEDAVRILYEHLLSLRKKSKNQKLYLYLYSRGGAVEVPWRIVNRVRELYPEFGVIIPYKAHSATTMIALGADEIVMGAKGELGPIDPIVVVRKVTEAGITEQPTNVEDVMSYISFLKEKAGITDQAAIASSVNLLTNNLEPNVIGNIYRTKSHMDLVARKLLLSRKNKPEENAIANIIEALVEKTYNHGHAIGRKEAIDLGLPIISPTATIEDAIWKLYVAYEKYFKLDETLDPRSIVEEQGDQIIDPHIIACIQSKLRYHEVSGKLKISVVRNVPPQFNLNLQLNIQPPVPPTQPGQPPPPQLTPAMINQLMTALQPLIVQEVKNQIEKQSPITGAKLLSINLNWKEITPYP